MIKTTHIALAALLRPRRSRMRLPETSAFSTGNWVIPTRTMTEPGQCRLGESPGIILLQNRLEPNHADIAN